VRKFFVTTVPIKRQNYELTAVTIIKFSYGERNEERNAVRIEPVYATAKLNHKSAEAKPGEYEGSSRTVIPFLAKKSRTIFDLWGGALSWSSDQEPRLDVLTGERIC
jgi:hypothetical protein